jgi:predicted RNA-binding Zn-ribbon protein involved in translation (DUF1610 family)
MICVPCQQELEPKETTLEYLGLSVTQVLPCCPKCGAVYISEELARGKMAQVEMSLEDK